MTPAKRRVLLVEDEYFILLLLQRMLENLGYDVVAKALTLSQARDAMEREAKLDLAVLDVNLNGERSYPLADELLARNVPVVFSTGFGRAGLDKAYERWPVLQKPYSQDELARALSELGLY